MTNTPLLDWTPPKPLGSTFEAERDGERLCEQARRVFAVIKDGNEHTLSEIAAITGDPEPSVSARLRDIRRSGRIVTRRYIERGLWAYRLGI